MTTRRLRPSACQITGANMSRMLWRTVTSGARSLALWLHWQSAGENALYSARGRARGMRNSVIWWGMGLVILGPRLAQYCCQHLKQIEYIPEFWHQTCAMAALWATGANGHMRPLAIANCFDSGTRPAGTVQPNRIFEASDMKRIRSTEMRSL